MSYYAFELVILQLNVVVYGYTGSIIQKYMLLTSARCVIHMIILRERRKETEEQYRTYML